MQRQTLQKKSRAMYALCLILLLACFISPAKAADRLIVFAAASLKTALDQIVEGYNQTQNQDVRISYAASSALARQIEQGAPADLFISADQNWMDDLAAKKLIAPETRVELLTNTLVLVTAKDSSLYLKISRDLPLAQALNSGRLAVAETETVPAGRYAKAALMHFGLFEQVADRLAQAENVRAALSFVARGEVPLGIVYGSDAIAEPRVRVVDVFPSNSHPAILYPAAATKEGNLSSAQRLLRYLRSNDAIRIWHTQGFRLAEY